MLVKIGSPDAPSDIVDLLVACHDRIRFFVDLAHRIGEAQNSPPAEIRDAATRVIKYFAESLPLHVADEEESIMPRLSGCSPELDATLQTMRREHQQHGPQLEALLTLCRTLQTEPEQLEQVRENLCNVATALQNDFVAHLRVEETVVMPAIRALLSDEDKAAMLAELRARRLSDP